MLEPCLIHAKGPIVLVHRTKGLHHKNEGVRQGLQGVIILSQSRAIGKSIPRKDAEEKVTGRARYTADLQERGTLHAALLVSPHAHAAIVSINPNKALEMPGVRAVVTGADYPNMTGLPLTDRPILSIDRVRYAGEPVAVVVADERGQAWAAAQQIEVQYTSLPVVGSPRKSFESGSPLLHPNLHLYKREEVARPIPGTNIATHTKIRKGNPKAVWSECDVVMTSEVSFPQSHHAAMETHCVRAEVFSDGKIHFTTTSQTPYSVPENIRNTFDVEHSEIRVHTPLVGGGFGGKAPVFIEQIVLAASFSVGGRKVELRLSREQCMRTMPGHIGLEAVIKLGAKRTGELVAAEITYWFDGGAYSDRGLIVTRAAATDCTGPYRIEHVHCDSYCMYTNHPPTTAYRGFGHPELTFVMERALDQLAERLHMDPLQIRRLNAIQPGDTTPTQARLTRSSVGDLPQCIERLESHLNWNSSRQVMPDGRIRAKGVACFWKTSSSPPNASSGAVVLVDRNGRVTLLSGAVEIGQGTKTALTQMVAEVFDMSTHQVDVVLEVDTKEEPEHWKTVASRTTFLAGNAAVRAAEDAVSQLTSTAAIAFGCHPSEVRITNGFAQCGGKSGRIPLGQLSHGYQFPDGRTVGSLVIGRGSYTIPDVTNLDPETGKGVPGPEWTVAAQGVEVEYDPQKLTYRIVHAVSVVDCGKVIHPDLALGQIKGGMSMGLSLASREGYVYTTAQVVANPQFRVYPIIRYGEQPQYTVDFVETPHLDAPWGLRGIGEHGLIGMPAALSNALSNATGLNVNQMPMTSELLWRLTGGPVS